MSRQPAPDPRQLAFTLEFRHKSYRAAVLAAVSDLQTYITAKEIAQLAGITYDQCIFALFALHNSDKVARHGRKIAAKWGPAHLAAPDHTGINMLESIFRDIAKVK